MSNFFITCSNRHAGEGRDQTAKKLLLIVAAKRRVDGLETDKIRKALRARACIQAHTKKIFIFILIYKACRSLCRCLCRALCRCLCRYHAANPLREGVRVCRCLCR